MKKHLANDGNYRELRYFSPWSKDYVVEDFDLPEMFEMEFGQETCKFGDGAIKTPRYLLIKSFSLASELCEELFTPNAPHINASLNGIEIITNGSASHHEFKKLHRRIDLIREATTKCGGIYLYANQQGCDGERVYYDGSALIVLNGTVLSQSSQFSLNDVEVITATVDLDDVISYRAGIISRGMQASTAPQIPLISSKIGIPESSKPLSKGITVKFHTPSEEIQYGPACWLWDYLRRSKQNGYFLPLSGGIDSCSTALIVFSMCQMLFERIEAQDEPILFELRSLIHNDTFVPKSPQDICQQLFHTAYMGTKNSGNETRTRARILAESISRYIKFSNIVVIWILILTVLLTHS